MAATMTAWVWLVSIDGSEWPIEETLSVEPEEALRKMASVIEREEGADEVGDWIRYGRLIRVVVSREE